MQGDGYGNPMSLSAHICRHIAETRGGSGCLGGDSSVGGGCINQTRRLECDGTTYFVKFNSADLATMFEAEALGLTEMAASNSIRVPQPVCWGTAQGHAYLVMENLDMGGRGSARTLGQQLATMHRHTQPQFGWHCDNTIGSTPQPNKRSDDWIQFWRDQRLGFQLELAASKGFGVRLQQGGAQLMARFPALFDGHQPAASMLHGDLWSGNYGFTQEGEPVIFDPAFYYGDREADLAMTELFGGFGADFYAGYQEAFPLDAGYALRKTFYNLYHILNHANLFGGGYASQAQGMIDRLLSELR